MEDIAVNLRRHSEIEDAVAFTARNQQETIIGAAVIKQDDSKLNQEQVRDHLAQWMPNYAIPQKIMFVVAFPETATGKINIRTLRNWIENNVHGTAKTH